MKLLRPSEISPKYKNRSLCRSLSPNDSEPSFAIFWNTNKLLILSLNRIIYPIIGTVRANFGIQPSI